MNTPQKMKETAAHLLGGFLLTLQAVVGVPFLLTLVGSTRLLDSLFDTKKPQ